MTLKSWLHILHRREFVVAVAIRPQVQQQVTQGTASNKCIIYGSRHTRQTAYQKSQPGAGGSSSASITNLRYRIYHNLIGPPGSSSSSISSLVYKICER